MVLFLWSPLPLACPGPGEEPPPLPADFQLSSEQVCPAPTSGIARLTEESSLRGLPPVSAVHEFVQSQVVAQDVDGDGDIDLVYPSSSDGRQEVHLNDGDGYFSSGGVLPETPNGPPSGSVGLTDIDGDGRPDAFYATSPTIWLYPNLGSGQFGTPVVFYDEPSSGIQYRYPSFSLGDADGDGDLDFAGFAHERADVGPPTNPDDGPSEFEGSRDVLLITEDGVAHTALELEPEGNGTLGLVGTFTDRDHDGDMDLLIPSDRDLSIAFWRNDGADSSGLPQLTDDAEAIHANVLMDGMGVDSADLNGDGFLDYCITDTGDPVCLVSDGQGAYIESGSAIGLVPSSSPLEEISTIGWSIDLADLDNDGQVEAVQSSGPLFDGPGATVAWPDRLWHGQAGGTFLDVTDEVGFGDLGPNYALATADFDGDGYLDIIVTGTGKTPLLWMNSCGNNAWLSIELIGLPGNQEALGARAEVTTGTDTQIRELYSLRGMGQGPSRFHFGLGEHDVADRLRIEWPDGSVSEAEQVPGRRFVRVTHPDLL